MSSVKIANILILISLLFASPTYAEDNKFFESLVNKLQQHFGLCLQDAARGQVTITQLSTEIESLKKELEILKANKSNKETIKK